MKFLPFFLLLALASLSACALISPPVAIEQRTSELQVEQVAVNNSGAYRYTLADSTIRVLSLNLAHGRDDSFSQFFVSAAETRQNLAEIVEFLIREDADIVTLQEADEASWWSGDFDHVEFLAREAGYRWFTHASHVDNLFGTYGTAVLSRFPITNGYRVDFNPTPPTTRKGFTLAEIEWTPAASNGKSVTIDVVSVHLDFASRSRRIEQIGDMKAILGKRSNPAIVLGDFNSSWQEGEHEIQALARVRQLKTHRPEANFLYTYADERFDWILVSEDFDFCNYYTAPDILSDHLAVVGEIVLLPDASRLADCSVL